VTQVPFWKQKNRRTVLVATASNPFWVVFMISPLVCPPCAWLAAKTLRDAAPLLTTVISYLVFAGGKTTLSPIVAHTVICACIAVWR
jgi:hypothetical protein